MTICIHASISDFTFLGKTLSFLSHSVFSLSSRKKKKKKIMLTICLSKKYLANFTVMIYSLSWPADSLALKWTWYYIIKVHANPFKPKSTTRTFTQPYKETSINATDRHWKINRNLTSLLHSYCTMNSISKNMTCIFGPCNTLLLMINISSVFRALQSGKYLN